MDLSGETKIPAPRAAVWQALNDEEILKQCIDGCESIERKSPTELEALVTAKVGPVKAKFRGDVTLSNIVAGESYTISGQGKGGAAGFAKGSADVRLADADAGEATTLTYDVKASVGGKLAQVGGRLIDTTARKYADDFFGKLTTILTEQQMAAANQTTAPTGDEPSATGPVRSAEASPVEDTEEAAREPAMPMWAWGLVLVVVVAGLLYYLA